MNKNITYILKTGFIAGLNSIFELIFLYIFSLYITLIISEGSRLGSNLAGMEKFSYYVNNNITALFLLVIIIRVCAQIFLLKYISNKIGIIISNVRKILFYEVLEQNASVKFASILDANINKVNALTVNFIPALVNVISEVILLLILLSGFVYITHQYIALLLIPITLYPLYKSASKSSNLGNGRRLLEDKFLSLYDYLFHSRIEILSIGKLSNIGGKFSDLSNEAIKQISKHYLFTQGPKAIIEFIVALMIFIIGLLNISAQNNLIVFLIALRVFPVLTRINGFLNQISYSYRIIGADFLIKYLFSNYSKKDVPLRTFEDVNTIEILGGEILHKQNSIRKLNPIKFQKGKLNIIRGRSGVGKTSLIYSLLGYGDFKLSQGVMVNKKFFDNLSFTKIGLYLNGGNKIIDDIFTYVSYYDVKYNKEKINYLLKNSNIIGLLEKDAAIHKFSSGELQRLDVVRMLYNPASLYILDEPTSNLDFDSFRVVECQLKKLALESLVIIVTHDNRFNLDEAINLD